MNTLLKNLLVKKWASSRLRNSNVAEGLKIRFENRKLLNILCFWLGMLNTIKMSVLSKSVYKINMISIKILMPIRQDDFKFYI